MDEVNRMECPVIPRSAADVDLMDPEQQECPYHAYKTLREEAPVYRDKLTGFYVLTRYDDLREVLKDPATFSNLRPRGPDHIPPERVQRIAQLFRDKGWLPAPTLSGRDDPEHKQMRALFDHTFRASRVKLMDPYVEQLSYQLIDDFVDDGHCDWVRRFAVPMPLIIIGKQMGAPEKDIWRIKAWTDAWVKRLGLMQTEEEAVWSAEMEIEQQH